MSIRQGNNIIAGVEKENLTGFVAAFAGSSAPNGWLVCDGSAISRNDYADLFAAIGTTYGSGDGSTTFNLPDLSGKLPLYDSGATLGSTTSGKAPNITGFAQGEVNFIKSSSGFYGGALYSSNNYNYQTRVEQSTTYNQSRQINIDASLSSSVYDDNATGITPAGIYTLWCIKY